MAEFGGYVGRSQTFLFGANGMPVSGITESTLQIDMASEFLATISNFTSSIDLKGVTVTSDNFSNGVLTPKDGAKAVAYLRFAGSYTTGDFVTQAIGSDTLVKHV